MLDFFNPPRPTIFFIVQCFHFIWWAHHLNRLGLSRLSFVAFSTHTHTHKLDIHNNSFLFFTFSNKNASEARATKIPDICDNGAQAVRPQAMRTAHPCAGRWCPSCSPCAYRRASCTDAAASTAFPGCTSSTQDSGLSLPAAGPFPG